MTVSRAVNNKSGLSDDTRERILEIVDRLGYRPNTIARGLVTKRTGTLGLVVPDNANPFFSEIAQGVEHAAYAEGYNVFLCNTEEDKEREQAVLYSLSEKLVDGVIICSSRLPDDELEKALAFHEVNVLINRVLPEHTPAVLRVDDFTGGRAAVNHLICSGHRAIGLLAGPENSFGGRERVRGYQNALVDAGLEGNPGWIKHCIPMVETGQEAARALLTENPEISGLFCHNDLVAVGALTACTEMGINVPEDLAIVGYDDIMLASLVTPPLTTCRVPRYELGIEAARLLLDQVDGNPVLIDKLIEPELIIRASAP